MASSTNTSRATGSTTGAATPPGGDYAFSNSAPEAADQLTCLQRYLDPVTTGVLGRLDIPTGATCLEIGAGAGSIARWLADRTGPSGRVVAVDLDTSRLRPDGTIEVHQHDVRAGLPVAGPFDLIHARLVLLHLPERRELLRTLVDQLTPGGWLVIGEFSRQPLRVFTAPTDGHAAVFARVTDTLLRVLERQGVDLGWAHQVHPAMVDAGLQQVHSVEYAETWTGGGPGCKLHHVNSLQKHDQLLNAGLTATELTRFRHLLRDPRFCARSWQFVCTRGRKPTTP